MAEDDCQEDEARDTLAGAPCTKHLKASFQIRNWWLAHALRDLLEVGDRWKPAPGGQIASVRQHVLTLSDHDFVDVVKLCVANNHCVQEILVELGRTQKLRARMVVGKR